MNTNECRSCVHNKVCPYCAERITILCDSCFQKKEIQGLLPKHHYVSNIFDVFVYFTLYNVEADYFVQMLENMKMDLRI